MTLDELSRPELTVTIRGTVYPLNPVDGYGMQLAQSAKTKVEMIQAMYKIAARCLKPHFTFDQVFGSEEEIGLSEQEVAQVVEAAQTQVKAVEATVPNGGQADAASGEVITPRPPASAPSMQLAT